MNDENAYNLIDEPWIPVLMQDGTNRHVSLGDVFADVGGSIADLALNPYERISVFRLLLCIAQAALGMERVKNERAWLSIKDLVGPISTEYLNHWHNRFFLYGPHAFLQINCLVAGNKSASTSKLVLHFASGNASTLFDHEARVIQHRPMTNSDTVRSLLTYLNYSAAGGSPTCIWKGCSTRHVGIPAAPCRGQSKLFTLLTGDSLLHSIWMNILTEKQLKDMRIKLGHPCWEYVFNNCETIEKETGLWLGSVDSAFRQISEPSWLGVLVPLSRFVKLTPNNQECLICEGFGYPQAPFWREPEATFFAAAERDGTETIRCLRINPDKEPWRDLSSILEMGRSKGGAIALDHLSTLALSSSTNLFSVWTGGVYSDADQDKDQRPGEWRFSCPVSLLRKSSLDNYRTAVEWASKQLFCRGSARIPNMGLKAAVQKYSGLLLVDDVTRFSVPAERIYWDLLAKPEKQLLVREVANDLSLLPKWKNSVRMAAEDAYRQVCPSATARQMEAFAQGFSKLTIREERNNE